ncbi:protein transport protein SEC16B homolog [Andrographis paniculata]|uniref:protein transport protein SEC16B homolog n=1 Tax=Andrographis paniculata TaxID=175694 RepID=UPI0021E826F4|nr:protein transport protein SEC16B homolog [Andrographis paniculata]XP_051129414.1 protein transport protein SEC16B homolog [Andrographis paniculata]
MASNPPSFLVEDNTDEDFFDKLVNDDDDVDFKLTREASKAPLLSDGNESDDAKAFANLGINELVDNDDGISRTDNDFGAQTKNVEQISGFGVFEKNGNSLDLTEIDKLAIQSKNEVAIAQVLADSSSASGDGLTDTNVVGKASFEPSDSTAVESQSSSVDSSDTALLSKSGGDSESPGVKEVGWNSFHADSFDNGDNGFGSYSDFFSEIGDGGNGGSAVGNAAGDSLKSRQKVSDWGENGTPDIKYPNYDPNDAQYWNQYPGWKYDPISEQWYPVDGNEAVENVLTSVHETEKVSYMMKTDESTPGIEAETTNWNQISQPDDPTAVIPSDWDQSSQVNSVYPPHILFDPQYPGWYYDSIAQEWKPLESYTESVSSTAQVQEQMEYNQQTYIAYNQGNFYDTQGVSNQVQDQGWTQPVNYYGSENSTMWQPNNSSGAATFQNSGSQFMEHTYEQNVSTGAENGQNTVHHEVMGGYNRNFGQNLNTFPMLPGTNQHDPIHVARDYSINQNSVDFSTKPSQISQSHISYAAVASGRSSAGRPAHALVTFGFGGKLIVLKDSSSPENIYSGSQNHTGSSISVLNLSEVINQKHDAFDQRLGACSYFQAVSQRCVPGPLSGGSVGSRDLNKWIDERIAESNSDMDYRQSEVSKLLLSLLKLSCQYYGKLRSPYGADAVLKENDAPESAVAKLFASARISGSQYGQHDAVAKCLQQMMPSGGQMQATAAEVQSLLVSGRKKEALQRAQEGQLWGPALVLAAQFGDQFYVETVKQMAHRLFVAGAPLRTLCLLIAGQPADVFSVDSTTTNSMAGALNMAPQPLEFGANGMLDDWAENLAVITANRTKDDELVLMHLGDCLWRERGDIIAAHICYLIAEASFESYSDTARMCLLGVDHFKFPRTYASPEAIQRTEIYEYSKTLGNSQFVLLPFQPYKLVYAHMLAEVGKISDAMKYCQVVLKSLKTARTPETEALRQLASSLEERIKSHQQGGFSTNLAPKKLVRGLLNLFDSTAHRVVGSMPPPVPTPDINAQSFENHQLLGNRVSSSQSTLAMSTLVPSQSLEPISNPSVDPDGKLMRTRSVSEPDFGRSPRQDNASLIKEPNSVGTQEKASSSGGTSRFGRFGFGSQLLQKTVGLVLKPRQGRQAKLGESNKFYYDEKLKRWVEEGAETPAQEPALPPPPPTTVFQNGNSEYNLKTALESQASLSNGIPESGNILDNNSGMPPLPPTSNQYSARGRLGVRSRYVDTFNKGAVNAANTFPVPSVAMKPAAGGGNPKFFVPTPVPAAERQIDAPVTAAGSDNLSSFPGTHLFETAQDTSGSHSAFSPTQSAAPPPPPAMAMPRFASMNNIPTQGRNGGGSGGMFPAQSRRVASWSGSFHHDALGSGNAASGMYRSSSSGDELDEVQL